MAAQITRSAPPCGSAKPKMADEVLSQVIEVFEAMDGLERVFTVTDEPGSELARGMIDKAFLQKHVTDFEQAFYVCGPEAMVEDVSAHLEDLGADPESLVFEE